MIDFIFMIFVQKILSKLNILSIKLRGFYDYNERFWQKYEIYNKKS